MRIIIDGKFNAHEDLTGADPLAIDVEEDVLKEIQKTKCFDVENNCVINYDNKDNMKIERIDELKSLLRDTDYKTLKYVDGEITEDEYYQVKLLRKSYREEIRYLEEELNKLQGN